MNKNILKYIPMLMALFMVSCSSDDTLEGINPSAEVPPAFDEDKFEVTGTKQCYEYYLAGASDKPLTRTALQYDRISNVMKASWEEGDKIGIFYLGDSDKNNQVAFVLDPNEVSSTENTMTGVFVRTDEAQNFQMYPEAGYISYIPYKKQDVNNTDFTYEAVPVSFRGQHQTANVKMRCYYQTQSLSDGDEKTRETEKYHSSEKAASAHLTAYDYQVSNVLSTPAAHVHFNYKSLASIVRFYMYAPAKYYFDSLQVVNNDADFVLDATMNVKEQTLSAVKTGHVLSLSFENADGSGKGIDMTNNTNSEKPTYDYWRTADKGCIMAYMMIAPINLKLCESSSTLYLCGHDEHETKHYYKATLSKLNFEAGKHHQWAATTIGDDEPITFEEVTVQTWTSAVYGNNGAGTETW